MSCLFCGSYFHLSQNCDIYVFDTQRKEILWMKKICERCFNPLQDHHKAGCNRNLKCFECYSSVHATMFCPNKFSAQPKPFLPKIDENLFQRFIEMCNPIEKLSFPSLPKFLLIPQRYFPLIDFNLLSCFDKTCHPNERLQFITLKALKNLKPVTVAHYLDGEYQNVEITDVFEFKLDNFGKDFSIPRRHFTKNAYLKPRIIQLINSNLTTPEFLELLSWKTKILNCREVKLSENVPFATVLEKMPNVQDIQIYETNIIIENSWCTDLLKHGNNSSYKFKNISLNITCINFDIECLVKLIKTNMDENAKISLYIDLFGDLEKAEILAAKLSSFYYFAIHEEYFVSQCSTLDVFIAHYNYDSSKNYVIFGKYCIV